MEPSYTWSFNKLFAKEYARYPDDQKDKIDDFIYLYQEHGMASGDFSNFPGKLCCSWRGLEESNPNFHYAAINNLWHYHIGIPEYVSVHSGFKTSKWVLHLQWVKGSRHIDIADLYDHYTEDNEFYLPSPQYLEKAG